eukprot:TRINITY_DN19258_c0_g2_i1.p1 TRINITY_DN19258_c0_g2~~TRINITY_DN19258_c0_g2_i1.p1  ORF type:complete len:541 (-),score=107.04 TRINITY_DN19258_c0_g2_i1:117-1739(-)
MIYYDSHHVGTLLQCHGSVFKQSLPVSVIAGILGFVIKFFEIQGWITLDHFDNSAVYSGFTFTISFIIVFRTSQSYNRFWSSACAVNTMRTQWYEAANNLSSFLHFSDKSMEEKMYFKNKLVRLFSMLNAVALGAVSSMEDENFPIIDVNGWKPGMLAILMVRNDERKTELVYQWIQSLIVKNAKSGLLNIPPPILTRVFQELERGMVEFNFVLQLMKIPFPFPYAQVTFMLINVYTVFTPFVMCVWTSHPGFTGIFTFISILGFRSINLIATELENPFGDDVNDLPVHDFHNEFNVKLMSLLDPHIDVVPELNSFAIMDYDKLLENMDHARFLSFAQYADRKSQISVDASCMPTDEAIRRASCNSDTEIDLAQLAAAPAVPSSTASPPAPAAPPAAAAAPLSAAAPAAQSAAPAPAGPSATLAASAAELQRTGPAEAQLSPTFMAGKSQKATEGHLWPSPELEMEQKRGDQNLGALMDRFLQQHARAQADFFQELKQIVIKLDDPLLRTQDSKMRESPAFVSHGQCLTRDGTVIRPCFG